VAGVKSGTVVFLLVVAILFVGGALLVLGARRRADRSDS
jgi:hypothetical protein